MAGDLNSVAVVVAKPRINVYTALVIVATLALLGSTILMLYVFNQWYGINQLFKPVSA